jgi:hypothetical protein
MDHMNSSVKIGFLGCGNVGGGVWRLLNGFAKEIVHRTGLSFEVKRVLVRDVNKQRGIDFPDIFGERFKVGVHVFLQPFKSCVKATNLFRYRTYVRAEVALGILKISINGSNATANGLKASVDRCYTAIVFGNNRLHILKPLGGACGGLLDLLGCPLGIVTEVGLCHIHRLKPPVNLLIISLHDIGRLDDKRLAGVEGALRVISLPRKHDTIRPAHRRQMAFWDRGHNLAIRGVYILQSPVELLHQLEEVTLHLREFLPLGRPCDIRKTKVGSH